MRLRTLPFRFKVLRSGKDIELTYLPKLGSRDVKELSSRLSMTGFGAPTVTWKNPLILRYKGVSSTIRVMPRGLLMAPLGTFERIGRALDFEPGHPQRARAPVSWLDNDYQALTLAEGGIIYHARPRHFLSVKRFASAVSKEGSMLSPDEVLMIAATAEACGAKSMELLTSRPGDLPDLSPPLPLPKGGFLHHVLQSAEGFQANLGATLGECLSGNCPVSPLANCTVTLVGGALPESKRRNLEDVAAVLERWVFDASYFSEGRGPHS